MKACLHGKDKAEWRYKDGWGVLACADWFSGRCEGEPLDVAPPSVGDMRPQGRGLDEDEHNTPLTPKQERFCQEIVIGQKLSDAYRTAFQPERASKKSVNERASRLRRSSKIVARIAELQTPVVAKVQGAMTDRLNELAYAMFLDPADCFDDFGRPLSIRAMSEHVRRAIAGYEVDPVSFVTKVRFIDKRAAIVDYTKLVGDMPTAHPKPPEPYKSKLPWQELSLEDRRELRAKVVKFIEEKTAASKPDAPKIGNSVPLAPRPSYPR